MTSTGPLSHALGQKVTSVSLLTDLESSHDLFWATAICISLFQHQMWSILLLTFSLSYYSPLTKPSHLITIEQPSVWSDNEVFLNKWSGHGGGGSWVTHGTQQVELPSDSTEVAVLMRFTP